MHTANMFSCACREVMCNQTTSSQGNRAQAGLRGGICLDGLQHNLMRLLITQRLPSTVHVAELMTACQTKHPFCGQSILHMRLMPASSARMLPAYPMAGILCDISMPDRAERPWAFCRSAYMVQIGSYSIDKVRLLPCTWLQNMCYKILRATAHIAIPHNRHCVVTPMHTMQKPSP